MDAMLNGALCGAAVVVSVYLGRYCLQKRDRAQKGLILAMLTEQGPMTGMQLKEAGVARGLIYNRLAELETEGLVESKELDESPLDLVYRGGLRRRVYWLKGGSQCST